MRVYQILPTRYYGGEIDLPDGTQGIPPRTTRTRPPPTLPGQWLIWNGNGWLLTKIAPPEPESQIVPEPGPALPEDPGTSDIPQTDQPEDGV